MHKFQVAIIVLIALAVGGGFNYLYDGPLNPLGGLAGGLITLMVFLVLYRILTGQNFLTK